MNNFHRAVIALLAMAPLLAAAPDPVACSSEVAAVLAAMRLASGGDHWSEIRTLHLSMTETGSGQTAQGEHWEDVVSGRYMDRDAWPTHSDVDAFDGITPWH